MLQSCLELIVQYPTSIGYRCRGFRGISSPQGVFIVFDGQLPGDQAAAEQVGEAFCAELLRWTGIREEPLMPCTGTRFSVECHALSEPACRKLLVALMDHRSTASAPGWPAPSAAPHWPNPVPSGNYEVLPVLPVDAPVATTVPPDWQHLNVAFWRGNPTEVLPAVFQRASLSPEENRVFISYLRRETSAIAEQLFIALAEANFDVFLDRFSVPIGVDFQKHLQQDLSDKAMVILINSPGIAASDWVAEEIATVKRYRLGFYELCVPNAPARLDVDADFRRTLAVADLKPEGNELSDGMLGTVIQEIKEIHARALHRRRYELADNFAKALAQAGRTAQAQGDGSFVVGSRSNSGTDCVVMLTPRPPALGNFCSMHVRHGLGSQRPGWLLSPAPNFLTSRQTELAWLSTVSFIRHVDESQLLALAATL
jgi:hypothetical protein